jgi:hypothetical protein
MILNLIRNMLTVDSTIKNIFNSLLLFYVPHKKRDLDTEATVLRIRDPGSSAFLPPGSGMNYASHTVYPRCLCSGIGTMAFGTLFSGGLRISPQHNCEPESMSYHYS